MARLFGAGHLAGSLMLGKRLPDVAWEDYVGWHENELQPGEYFKLGKSLWACKAPNGDEGTIGLHHVVVEHEDGTITAMPSLQFETGKRWHGFLERGVWRS